MRFGPLLVVEARSMERKKLSAEALALIYLREARRWTQQELARAKGHSGNHKLISRYENGALPLSRKELDAMAAQMGYSREAVDGLLFIYSLVSPPSPPESGSPVDPTPEELRRIDRAVIAAEWTRAAELRARLIADKKRRKADEARRDAGELWARLKTLPSRERRELVEDSSEFRSWAVVERLCLESERAAADSASKALDLAGLALFTAARAEGNEALRRRLQGYAWAYIANARRVVNDHPGSNEAFARTWELWRTGEDAGLLPEWRMLSMEASLRRGERRFSESLELLTLAYEAADADAASRSVLLLNKAFVCEQMGDYIGARATLANAAPFVEATGDARLLFALRFETTKSLCALDRYAEAADMLPVVRELATRLGNELDLLRVVWLGARVAAGQGQRKEAVAGLEQVRWGFLGRGLPYDAALAALELAVLHLEDGKTAEVKALAREMVPIFHLQGIAREAVATLALFQEAAQQATATVELALRAIAEIRKIGRTAPLLEKS
jgi:transcriptional regulator with XRE-family HTH domain